MSDAGPTMPAQTGVPGATAGPGAPDSPAPVSVDVQGAERAADRRTAVREEIARAIHDARFRWTGDTKVEFDEYVADAVMAALPPAEPMLAARHHRDALADTHDAYTAFRGWTLRCLWCEHETRGQTKGEALARMQDHYNDVLPEGADLR